MTAKLPGKMTTNYSSATEIDHFIDTLIATQVRVIIQERLKNALDNLSVRTQLPLKNECSEPPSPVPDMYILAPLPLIRMPDLREFPSELDVSEFCHLIRCEHEAVDPEIDEVYTTLYKKIRSDSGPVKCQYQVGPLTEQVVSELSNIKSKCGILARTLSCDLYTIMIGNLFQRGVTLHENMQSVIKQYGVTSPDHIKELAKAAKDLKDKSGLPPLNLISRANIFYDRFFRRQYDKFRCCEDTGEDACKKLVRSLNRFIFYFLVDRINQALTFQIERNGENLSYNTNVESLRNGLTAKLANSFESWKLAHGKTVLNNLDSKDKDVYVNTRVLSMVEDIQKNISSLKMEWKKSLPIANPANGRTRKATPKKQPVLNHKDDSVTDLCTNLSVIIEQAKRQSDANYRHVPDESHQGSHRGSRRGRRR